MDEECLDVVGRRFSKIRRHTLRYIENFGRLMPQQIGANRRKNRSIQVIITQSRELQKPSNDSV